MLAEFLIKMTNRSSFCSECCSVLMGREGLLRNGAAVHLAGGAAVMVTTSLA